MSAPDLDALSVFLADRRAVPFGWGGNDCVAFGLQAVRHAGGVDVVAAMALGQWSSERTARRKLRAVTGVRGPQGVAAFFAQAAAHFEWPNLSPAAAPRGALALVADGDGRWPHRFGVIWPGGRVGDVVSPGASGLVWTPRAAVARVVWPYLQTGDV